MKMAYLYSMWSFIAHDLFLWWRQSSKWEWKCFSWGSCSELTPCHLFHSLLSKASQEDGPNSRNRDTDSSSLQGAWFQGEVGNWDPFYNQSTGARVKCQDQGWLSLCLTSVYQQGSRWKSCLKPASKQGQNHQNCRNQVPQPSWWCGHLNQANSPPGLYRYLSQIK